MLPYLFQAAATIGAIGLAYTIPPRGYIRRSDCPDIGAVDRLAGMNQDLIAENLRTLQMLERRDIDLQGADKTIAELVERVEAQARVLAAIVAQQTSGANATVRRMASLARKAA